MMKKIFKSMLLAFFMLSLGITLELSAQESSSKDTLRADWSGYLKHMSTTIYHPFSKSVLMDGLLQNRINLNLYGDHSPWSAHAGLRTRVFYGNFFELDSDRGATINDENNDYLPLSANLIDNKHLLVNSYLDRLYLQWSRKSWEVRLGRQRINWGISTFWNPNDLFNTFDFTDFDYEERPGSDALRVTWYSGPVSRLEGAIKFADNWDEVTAAILYRWNVAAFDFQIIGGKYRKNLTLGGGWSGYMGDVGFKGEMMYFNSYDALASHTFNLTAGFDYLIGGDLYTSAGYLYNKTGSINQGTNLFVFQLSARNLYPYRHAIYGNINYLFTPLLSGGLSVVYSPVPANPWFLSPTLTYNVAQNWDLDLVSQIFVSEPTVINLNIFAWFLRVKWSF